MFPSSDEEDYDEEDFKLALPEELCEEFDDYDDEVDACFIKYLANSRKRGM